MATTTTVELAGDMPEEGPGSLKAIYSAYYGASPFVTITGKRVPQTRDVWGSNRCDIGWHREGGHLILFSVIDNLVKGAAGNAVQCMNVRFDLDEAAGLRSSGEL
jgi:N-acetyl-gamma-glutamyl-phosphate reductase